MGLQQPEAFMLGEGKPVRKGFFLHPNLININQRKPPKKDLTV